MAIKGLLFDSPAFLRHVMSNLNIRTKLYEPLGNILKMQNEEGSDVR